MRGRWSCAACVRAVRDACRARGARRGVRHSGVRIAREKGDDTKVEDLKFDAQGLIPCVVQQYDTGEVLMVAWMNAESVALTLETGTTWFWSRSRQELWNKGATSGNMQQLRELLVDCDADTLLARVDSPGPACHTGNRTCFFRTFDNED